MEKKIKARSIPFSKTRSHHASETAEDYVEAVMDLIKEQGECRVMNLAKYFNVSHVTVSRTVKRLQDENLLYSQPYKPVQLTAEGAQLAKSAKERHKIVLAFLIRLGVDKTSAEIDSEGIEHHVSTSTLNAMKQFLKS
ncbi:MAG: transcriptional regulator MntR [Gammaproteobacteria bacterium]|nr:transcriptional regulator MntR [Gammaproteobacteria bacterium]